MTGTGDSDAAATGPTVPATGAGTTDWADAWEQALTALELDVAQAEAALAADHLEPVPVERWQPPQVGGPLPRALADRARALHGRQLEVARQLGDAAQLSRRHQRAAAAMRSGGAAVPVYVDVAG